VHELEQTAIIATCTVQQYKKGVIHFTQMNGSFLFIFS